MAVPYKRFFREEVKDILDKPVEAARKVPGLRYLVRHLEEVYFHRSIDDSEIRMNGKRVAISNIKLTKEEVERATRKLLAKDIMRDYIHRGTTPVVFSKEGQHRTTYEVRPLDFTDLYRDSIDVRALESFRHQIQNVGSSYTLMVGMLPVIGRGTEWVINFSEVQTIPVNPQGPYTSNQLERIKQGKPILPIRLETEDFDKDADSNEEQI